MEIDPVVVLADELRATESALRNAVHRYELDQAQENGEAVNTPAGSLKSLYRDIAETMPTSAMGASEMVRLAAQRLPFSLSRYVSHFHEVADRLGEGRREHADLVWLRAMRAALKGGACGEQGHEGRSPAQPGDCRRRPAGRGFPCLWRACRRTRSAHCPIEVAAGRG